jgi:hypothetical protein
VHDAPFQFILSTGWLVLLPVIVFYRAYAIRTNRFLPGHRPGLGS